MDTEQEEEVKIIARQIFEYLQSHPSAADSLQGVMRWWLAGEAVSSRERVLRALESLVREGVVGRRSISDGGVIFYSLEKL
ncbi:hypothetical protein EUZ85_14645 [Hahella sp. KA22]|uniref:hypothetical protein n=1 Tax=Hahella sp. KA22 TaxID=1628392 RepID=UPI000FDED4F7|nr:hypothetical protein [Hahella sp. KA22]AZZ91899.1 hypothetical protein ENC22_12080 [Hahella sp. KA22]QAY55270.1 hypothetical protein EUZ85_14645 [Hahella sp. KA22]